MPLLERSATSLEQWSLQKAVSSVRTRRKLHTSFWRHGAASLELSLVQNALPSRASLKTPGDFFCSAFGPGWPEPIAAPPLQASLGLPLDFLYPQWATVSAQQRLYPGLGGPDLLDRPRACVLSKGPVLRGFSSSSLRAATTPRGKWQRPPPLPPKVLRKPEEYEDTPLPEEQLDALIRGQPEIPTYPQEVEAVKQERGPVGVPRGRLDKDWRKNQGSKVGAQQSPVKSKAHALVAAANKSNIVENIKKLDQMWDRYEAMSKSDKASFRANMILVFSESNRLSDALKLTEVFAKLPENEWSQPLAVAAIDAHLKHHNVAEAMDIFKRFANIRVSRARDALPKSSNKGATSETNGKEGLPDDAPPGFGLLAAYALKSERWDMLEDAWVVFNETPAKGTWVRGVDKDIILAVPDLTTKLWAASEVAAEAGSRLESFMTQAMSWALHLFDSRTATSIVELSEEPQEYAKLINLAIERKQKALAAHLYTKYRELPKLTREKNAERIPKRLLRALIARVFIDNGDGIAHMELVRQDWYKHHGRFDLWAYLRYLHHYASQRDTENFYVMEKELLAHYPESAWEVPSHRLRLFSLLGDPLEARKCFDSMKETYGVKEPWLLHWNLLLSAHQHAHNGAVEVFAQLSEAITPDETSFSIIMSIMGKRGELPFVLQLQQLAVSMGLEITTQMEAGLVEAYCHHDCFHEAQDICRNATQDLRKELATHLPTKLDEKRVLKRETVINTNRAAKAIARNPTTTEPKRVERKIVMRRSGASRPMEDVKRLWNIVIKHHAVRRDLVNMRHTLRAMADAHVEYDSTTYYNLLLGLVYCRQANHALHLIRAAEVDGIFKPTTRHYVLLMAAYVETDQPHLVLHVGRLMDKMGNPKTRVGALRGIIARTHWRKLITDRRGPHGVGQKESFGDAVQDLLHYLRTRTDRPPIQPSDTEEPSTELSTTPGPPVRSPEVPADMFAAVIFFAVKKRLEHAARQLIDLYFMSLSPAATSNGYNDIRLMCSLMTFELYSKNFENVLQLWEAMLKRAIELGRPVVPLVSGKEIVPPLRLALHDGIRVMQTMLRDQGDVKGLQALVKRVKGEGFELTSLNVNFQVQALAKAGDVEGAFALCEESLMPAFVGWRKFRPGKNITLEKRRLGMNPWIIRPSSLTIAVLRRCFRGLSADAVLSQRADRLQQSLPGKYPKTMRAIMTSFATIIRRRRGRQLRHPDTPFFNETSYFVYKTATVDKDGPNTGEGWRDQYPLGTDNDGQEIDGKPIQPKELDDFKKQLELLGDLGEHDDVYRPDRSGPQHGKDGEDHGVEGKDVGGTRPKIRVKRNLLIMLDHYIQQRPTPPAGWRRTVAAKPGPAGEAWEVSETARDNDQDAREARPDQPEIPDQNKV